MDSKGYTDIGYLSKSHSNEPNHATGGWEKSQTSRFINVNTDESKQETVFLPKSLLSDLNTSNPEEEEAPCEVFENESEDDSPEVCEFEKLEIENQSPDERINDHHKIWNNLLQNTDSPQRLNPPQKNKYYSQDDLRNLALIPPAIETRPFNPSSSIFKATTSMGFNPSIIQRQPNTQMKFNQASPYHCGTPTLTHNFRGFSNAMACYPGIQLPQQMTSFGYTNVQAFPNNFYQNFAYCDPNSHNMKFNQQFLNMQLHNCNTQGVTKKKKKAKAKTQQKFVKQSRNLSLDHPGQKNNSSSQSSPKNSQEVTSPYKETSKKAKSSLFNLDRDDDYSTLEEILASLSMPLYAYVKTQKGSRKLQKLLNNIPPEKIDLILDHLKENFWELMIDTYGNYFCQKFIQCCSAEQRIIILKSIKTNFVDISCNASGTHALQSLIEIVNMPEEGEMIRQCVEGKILELAVDSNGTHVIQKWISCLNENQRMEINGQILEHFHKLIVNSNGICVLKRLITGNENTQSREKFLSLLYENTLEIIQNPFGNYVAQQIIIDWGAETCKELLDTVIQNIVSLSMQKFSSNVVEKCFDIANAQSLRVMYNELFRTGKVNSLLKNKYGSFVLHKAISLMTLEEKCEIKDELTKKVSTSSSAKEKKRLASLLGLL